jgi:hypothetical protein
LDPIKLTLPGKEILGSERVAKLRWAMLGAGQGLWE